MVAWECKVSVIISCLFFVSSVILSYPRGGTVNSYLEVLRLQGKEFRLSVLNMGVGLGIVFISSIIYFRFFVCFIFYFLQTP